MVLDGFFANRLKRPIPYVESHLGGGDVAIREGTKKLRREVKPRGGSRHRPSLARINRLVTFPISLVGLGALAFDVRRKRGLAYPIENLVEVSLINELNASFAKLQDVLNDRPKLSLTEDDPRSDTQFLCGARQDLPDIALVGLEQQELDQTTGLDSPEHLGGKDTGVVDNQQIPRP
jgi:hypothetical protein